MWRKHREGHAARHHAALRLLPGSGEPLSDLISMGLDILDSAPFDQARTLPEACQPCEFRDSCHGGCAGRRRLQGALLEPDYYCPIVRGERRSLRVRMAATRDLPKMSSSCTTVVMAVRNPTSTASPTTSCGAATRSSVANTGSLKRKLYT